MYKEVYLKSTDTFKLNCQLSRIHKSTSTAIREGTLSHLRAPTHENLKAEKELFWIVSG